MLIMRHGSIHDVLRVGGGEIGCCRTREVMYVHGFERIEIPTLGGQLQSVVGGSVGVEYSLQPGLGESHLIANAELGDGCCGGVGVFQNLGANKVGGACPDTSHDKPDEGFFADCSPIYIPGCVFLGASGKAA